tara:strand:- start:1567 stop:2157 length:591 start_codon:yes stop_codon:yes gene_type:complete
MNIDFKKGDGLVPVIIQNSNTFQVLMLGYMDEEAFLSTKKTKKVVFYSRSKKRLWKKGETSGNELLVKNILTDCDSDTILIFALPNGPTCHKGNISCFDNDTNVGFIYSLENIINKKENETSKESYTKYLLKKGTKYIARKVGEETLELILDLDNEERLKNEFADLLYHMLVLLKSKKINLSEIDNVLKERSAKTK